MIRVHAAGVNPVDWKIREGHLKQIFPISLPLIPGWDVSGVIEDTGTGVTRLKVGDEVFGLLDITRDGAYAQYVAVKESRVAHKPKSIDHFNAAAIPLA